MTSRHQKLEADLEIIDHLLNKRYQNGQGLDSGTRDHLLKRKGEIQATAQVFNESLSPPPAQPFISFVIIMDYSTRLDKTDHEVLYTALEDKIKDVFCRGGVLMYNEVKELTMLKVRLLNSIIHLEDTLRDENHEPL